MKKIILVSCIVCSSLLAERYSMLLEYNFIKGCSKGGQKNINRCICILTEIEKVASQSEMIDFSLKASAGQKVSDELNAKMMGAVIKCVKK